jgi:YD repeat-containing protein
MGGSLPRSPTTRSNRVAQKSYAATGTCPTTSLGSSRPATPKVNLCYDGAIGVISNGGNTVTCTSALSNVNSVRRLTWEGNATSSDSYTVFDPMGRVWRHSQTTGSTYPFQYTYNSSGQLEMETYPSGRKVASCYDIAARPVQVQNVTGSTPSNYASSVTYMPHGAISSATLGNNLQENYQYSGDRLQLNQIAASYNTTNFLTLNYGYCGLNVGSCATNNGNVQNQTMTHQMATAAGAWTDTYTYDTVNRLTAAQETGTGSWVEGYSYDAFGNRTVCDPTQGCTNPGRTGLPALTAETPNMAGLYNSLNQINGWTYDGSGNTLQVGTMARNFVYDAENRQVAASVAGIGNTYAYDGEGRRVQKRAWGARTTYVYDAFGQLAAEYGTPDDTGTKYLTADALGSTRLETAVGTGGPVLSQNYDYLPFGQELGSGTSGRDATFSPGAYPSAAADPSMKLYRQGTGLGDRPRLLRGEILLGSGGQVDQSGSAVCGPRHHQSPELEPLHIRPQQSAC